MTTFSVSLTNITVLLPHSHDYVFYVSRRTLAPPPFCPQKHSDLSGHDFAQFPELSDQPRLAQFICALSWRLFGINPAIQPNADGVSVFHPNLRNYFFRSF